MTGRKGRAEQDTEGEYGRDGYGEGEYGQSGTREQHGQSTRGEYGQSAVEPSEHQPSMMDKIKGTCDHFSVTQVFGIDVQSIQVVLRSCPGRLQEILDVSRLGRLGRLVLLCLS